MIRNEKIYLSDHVFIEPAMLNRHGLITGATGTGKTVSVKLLIEALSDLGVPTFIADIKGDLSGLGQAGQVNQHIQTSLDKLDLADFAFRAYPVTFWDIFKEKGIPLRTTVSNMGPLMLAQMMDLNDTQTGVLLSIFKAADAANLAILDFKDLKSVVIYAQDHRKELEREFGLMSSQSLAAIMRKLLILEEQNMAYFFGEPAFEVEDFFSQDGMIHILDAIKLYQYPSLYASFLLWLLSELFENLPEVGDLDKPKMVFFFEEAHLLFKDMPKILEERLEMMVKLIRSKGVGVFFITQNPQDIPDSILSQLGNKIQHALRAYTPKEQKVLKAAAESFRENPDLDTVKAIQNLETGEALVSFLDASGIPAPVQQVRIYPPKSYLGELDGSLRQTLISQSPFNRIYREEFDRESAYEILMQREEIKLSQEQMRLEEEQAAQKQKQARPARRGRMTPLERSVNSAFNTMGREVGRSIMRGIMGTLTGKKR